MRYAWFVAFSLAFFTGSAAAARAESPPVILQMANGQFYAPSSGKTAATREELLASFGIASSTAPVAPALPNATTTPAVAPAPDDFPLMRAIRRSRAFLDEQVAADRKAHPEPRRALTDADWRSVTLAVWNPQTDEIRLRRAKKKGTKLQSDDGEPLEVSVRFSRELYSEYEAAGGNVVVAIRYPQYVEQRKGKRKIFEIREVVYTPYARGLHTPEMVEWGRQVVGSVIRVAGEDLDARNVRSWAFPDRRITEVVDPRLAEAVVMIEHTDHRAVQSDPRKTIETVYVNLAANEDRTYAYSQSSAGATGLVQFMPASYRRFARARPELGLDNDFTRGMRDPKNAVKAEIAYLDYLLAALPPDARASSTPSDEFMVAAYNGGPARVKKALSSWDSVIGASADARSTLKQRRQAMEARIETLRKKILAEESEDIWKPWQKRLNGMRKELADLRALERDAGRVPLKRETIDYVRKYRSVIRQLRDQETATEQAAAITPTS